MLYPRAEPKLHLRVTFWNDSRIDCIKNTCSDCTPSHPNRGSLTFNANTHKIKSIHPPIHFSLERNTELELPLRLSADV